MKLSKITSFLIIPALLITASCKKTFFTNVNNNPNVLASVKPNLLLPTVEASMAYTINGDISRYTSIITQQVLGANSQAQQYYQYNFNPGVFENLWGDLYTSVLENNHTLIKISDAGGYNEYSGISRIIMAYTLQVAVDLWGDIPYSKAFTGNETSQDFHPAYDKDKALYDTISTLVDQGIAKLGESVGGITPSTDDVIYGGAADKWIKFGHAIKARLAIHQSKANAAMAATALSEIALSFTSTSDNAQYIFGTTETAANSWYQFYRDRPGDINWEPSTLATDLKSSNDPRYAYYDLDSVNPVSKVSNSFFNMVNSPAEFITYDELQFMKAEASLRIASPDAVTAQTAFVAGITEDMKKVGVANADIATFIAVTGPLPAGTDAAIAKIAAQEYIALFLNPEAFTLYRRTGVPALVAQASAGVPRRLLYPQSELSYNSVNVPAVTLYTPRIFWDQ